MTATNSPTTSTEFTPTVVCHWLVKEARPSARPVEMTVLARPDAPDETSTPRISGPDASAATPDSTRPTSPAARCVLIGKNQVARSAWPLYADASAASSPGPTNPAPSQYGDSAGPASSGTPSSGSCCQKADPSSSGLTIPVTLSSTLGPPWTVGPRLITVPTRASKVAAVILVSAMFKVIDGFPPAAPRRIWPGPLGSDPATTALWARRRDR
jgi:hypothetical protein